MKRRIYSTPGLTARTCLLERGFEESMSSGGSLGENPINDTEYEW